MELLFESTPLFLLWVFVFSALVGSFLNVVIYRLPLMMKASWRAECNAFLELDDPTPEYKGNLLWPPSTCPSCNNRIRPWHNIPILGYLILGGKCKDCSSKISLRYPVIEAITALLAVLVAWQLGPTLACVAVIFLTFVLVALTGIDYDHHLLPDSITIPLIWVGLILNSAGVLTDLESALWGAVFGYLSLWLVFWAFKLITGKEGMGYGDFKLLAALGAWLGWQYLPSIILISSVLGVVFGLSFMALKGQDKQTPIAFGPYLAWAGWVCLMLGDSLSAFLPFAPQ